MPRCRRSTGRCSGAVLLPLVLLLLLASRATASAPAATPAFSLRVDGENLTVESASGASVTDERTGEGAVAFRILSAETAEGEVVFREWNVSAPRQIVPRIGGAIPEQRHLGDLPNATAAAYNMTASPGALRFVLRVPPGNHSVEFVRDVTPPRWTVEPPSDVTHNSALVVSRTDEASLATLVLANPRVGDVLFSTPHPSGRQTFPISGLDPETSYSFTITFEDFSGNAVASGVQVFRTGPRPVVPIPTIELLSPSDGSTTTEPVGSIRARIDDAASPVRTVALYVDKRFVPDAGRLLSGSTLQYHPAAPLGTGRHTLLIEATNELGGEARLLANFIVEPRPAPVAAIGLLGLAVSVALLLDGKERRRDPDS